MSINLIGICMLSDFLDVCAWFNKVVQLKVSKSPPEARCHGSNDQARASVNVKLDKHKHTCTHYTPRFGSTRRCMVGPEQVEQGGGVRGVSNL